MDGETCERCTYWRTVVGPERRVCSRLGYVTGATATCGWYKEALPFDEEPEEDRHAAGWKQRATREG